MSGSNSKNAKEQLRNMHVKTPRKKTKMCQPTNVQPLGKRNSARVALVWLFVFRGFKRFLLPLPKLKRAGRVLVSAERSDADLYQDKHTSCGHTPYKSILNHYFLDKYILIL